MQFFNKDDVLNAFHYRVSTRSYDGDKKTLLRILTIFWSWGV